MEDLYNFKSTVLKSEVEMSEIDKVIFKNFDFEFDGKTEFTIPHLSKFEEEFGIGVIYGSSGSGKTSILNQYGKETKIEWDNNKSVASHFDSVEDAIERLGAVGLNTVPTWAKPRHVLSNGEGFRCDLARRLGSNIVIDEFTSVVNRDVAKSCSLSLSKYVNNSCQSPFGRPVSLTVFPNLILKSFLASGSIRTVAVVLTTLPDELIISAMFTQ